MTVKNKIVMIISLTFIVLAIVYFYFAFLAFDLDHELRYQLSKFKYPECKLTALGHTIKFKNDQYAGNGFWSCNSKGEGKFTANNSIRDLLITINTNIEDINLDNCNNKIQSINSNLIYLWYCSENEEYGDIGKGYLYLTNNKKNKEETLFVTVVKNNSIGKGINGVDSAVIYDFLNNLYVDGKGTQATEFRPRFTGY